MNKAHYKQKLLVICGPTATGKTKLASYLANKFNGVLISADSRMVYKHMDIGTGKDIKKYGKILGYDLVLPNEEFSISQYSKYANNMIKDVVEQKKLPILVGGSGLYIKSIIGSMETIDIPRNKTLRENLKDKSVLQLQKILKNGDPEKLELMNDSDRNNPRRLVRAIEIVSNGQKQQQKESRNYDTLFIGLIAEKEVLSERINKRVEERIKNGFEKEILYLKKNGFWKGAPTLTLGYKDWPNVDKWKSEEFKYAKRQITWFKREKEIKWFDITKPYFEKDVERLTQKWYSGVKYAA